MMEVNSQTSPVPSSSINPAKRELVLQSAKLILLACGGLFLGVCMNNAQALL
jgi:hypothetical protein